jgi:biotin/methionine sulfoxide reductase
MSDAKTHLTSSHWGAGLVRVKDGKLTGVDSHADDPAPSAINDNIASSLNGRARVLRPAIRKGWLEKNTTPRGRDEFVEVSWDTALDHIASELNRVRTGHGNASIFGGSYGWASAGRFHHAQSQLKRFLNSQGGFVRSEGNYSFNAALDLMPFIVGPYRAHVAQATRWSVIAEHTELMIMFGGMAERNTQVSDGGFARHRMQGNLDACVQNGVEFINISPLRTDFRDGSQWVAARPGSDVALMMGLAHTLLCENLHNQAFLDRYTVGFDRFKAYLTGETDGQAKDADWAASHSDVPAENIRDLARKMAMKCTMISLAAGVQRTDFGEQPLWMVVTLAAMLGQIGLPGGGYVIGYGVNGNIGNMERPFPWGALPQGDNPVSDFIPVAMISEMLLNAGKSFDYLGDKHVFPDARLVWWAGGNPFHHHQDLNRLHAAFQTPETVIVNEINWTATARHADIVLPVAAPQERLDFGAGKSDNALIPMPQAVAPASEARVEFDIYADLEQRLGNGTGFTNDKSQNQWLRDIWKVTQDHAIEADITLPDWDDFIAGDIVVLPDPSPNQVFLADFRADPIANPLPTPSGKIELFSDIIAGFDLPDCPGHATWFAPRDQTAKTHPLFLISGQPKTRLHSQLDNGDYSRSHKIQGREPILIHPDDAAIRGINDGDIVEVSNDRGRCLAGAKINNEIRVGCVFLWTGAWFDPDFDAPQSRDRHGNPNVLTHDKRTSSLTQSPASHSAMVDIAKFTETLPEIQAFDPPKLT